VPLPAPQRTARRRLHQPERTRWPGPVQPLTRRPARSPDTLPPAPRTRSVLPGGGRAMSSNKAVRFEVARAAGITSNRDWGLLYASPELLHKRQ
jgi:hypothetical protein